MTKPILNKDSDISNIKLNALSFYRDYDFTECFIEKYHNKLLSHYIIRERKLSEELLLKLKDKFHIITIIQNQIISESFIEKFIFVEKTKNRDLLAERKLFWFNLLKFQDLSDNFLEKYINQIDWYAAATYSKLSNKFIAKYLHKLNFNSLKENKKIDQEFIEKLELLKM